MSGRNIARPDAMYGSDQAGMVCAYAFVRGGPGRAVDFNEAAALLLAPPGERAEFLWLHFSLANAASGRWLREHARLPDTFFETQDSASTRLEVTDDALTGMLNDMQFFAVEASAASTMTLHVTPGLLVTAHATALRVDRLRASVRAGEVFASPPDLLAHLLRDQADVLVAIVRDAAAVDAIEDRILSHVAAAGSSWA